MHILALISLCYVASQALADWNETAECVKNIIVVSTNSIVTNLTDTVERIAARNRKLAQSVAEKLRSSQDALLNGFVNEVDELTKRCYNKSGWNAVYCRITLRGDINRLAPKYVDFIRTQARDVSPIVEEYGKDAAHEVNKIIESAIHTYTKEFDASVDCMRITVGSQRPQVRAPLRDI